MTDDSGGGGSIGGTAPGRFGGGDVDGASAEQTSRFEVAGRHEAAGRFDVAGQYEAAGDGTDEMPASLRPNSATPSFTTADPSPRPTPAPGTTVPGATVPPASAHLANAAAPSPPPVGPAGRPGQSPLPPSAGQLGQSAGQSALPPSAGQLGQSAGQPGQPPSAGQLGQSAGQPGQPPSTGPSTKSDGQSAGPGAEQLPPSVRSAGWSPLGAAPSAPPVLGGASPAGKPQYLPPVAPPSAVTTTEAVKSSGSGARWGWRALVAFLAGGLIAAGGFGAAQLDSTTDLAATDTTVPTTIATTPSTVRDSGTVPLVPPDVDEPAAFVAQTLGPSVVQLETDRGLGSGVVFGDGLILTNNHVIAGAESVRVKLADGRVLPGTVLGSDANTDVGVVSVGPGQELPIAPLATGEKPTVGQVAIAIGSPFDLQQSVTAGIVSAVDRPVQNNPQSVVAMIQTDAPINPGNSGGALADRRGRVIGINTSIQTDGLTAANVGVGFAIPIDTAIRIADLLVAGEPIEPGFLGVRGIDPPGGEAGVQLTEVTAGSAADQAGLLVGDRVLSIDDAPVTGFAELAGLVLANQAGDTVTLDVIRDEQLITIEVTLGLREGN